MIPDIFTILNQPSVNAFVGSRIYGAGHAGDSPQYPYITWQVISGQPNNLLSEAPTIDNARVQINIWSRSESEVRQAAEAARDVLDLFGYQSILIGPQKDPDTKSYRIQMDYSIWSHR